MGSSQSLPAPVQRAAPMSEKTPTVDKATTALKRLQLSSANGSPSDGQIHVSALSSWEDGVQSDKAKRLARNVLSKQDIMAALIKQDVIDDNPHVFNLKITNEAKSRTNQKASGRCWLFAVTNVIRLAVMDRYKLEEFEISQSYLCFYDWLEKSNWFLEQMIDLAEEPTESRINSYLLGEVYSDGGQWDMLVNILDKYGCVPQKVYGESWSSSNSSKIHHLLLHKLRENAVELRAVHANALASVNEALGNSHTVASKRAAAVAVARQRKDEQMAEVYTMLSIALGAPPQPDDEFTWDFNDKDGKFHTLKSTAKQFYKKECAPFSAADCISLIHDPRNKFDKLYTVDRLGNIYKGRPILYVNTTVEELIDNVVLQLKSNKAVWFGCDVGAESDNKSGVMAEGLFDYDSSFGVKFGMTKAERLAMGQSMMTHAMVITAAHIVDGKAVRFRVENSWSDTVGEKGFMVMSRAWFEEYCFQVVVPRGMTAKKNRDLFEAGNPVVLDAWDPLGALA